MYEVLCSLKRISDRLGQLEKTIERLCLALEGKNEPQHKTEAKSEPKTEAKVSEPCERTLAGEAKLQEVTSALREKTSAKKEYRGQWVSVGGLKSRKKKFVNNPYW